MNFDFQKHCVGIQKFSAWRDLNILCDIYDNTKPKISSIFHFEQVNKGCITAILCVKLCSKRNFQAFFGESTKNDLEHYISVWAEMTQCFCVNGLISQRRRGGFFSS